jgi:phosphatidylserine/phosphatidylglycerophosphate/cardiolipin synthase-like enzyme
MDIGMISSHLSNQGTVKFGNLRQWLLDQSLSRQQANALIGQLFALDLVDVEKLGESLEDAVLCVRPAAEKPTIKPAEKHIKAPPEFDFVLTCPADVLPFFVPSTLEAFKAVVREAKKELLILSPFMDLLGVHLLRDDFCLLIEQKVPVRVMTRKPDEAVCGFLNTLLGNLVSIRFLTNYRAHRRLHAKLLMADRSVAYLGSAEIRLNAMVHNIEMGALVRDSDMLNQIHTTFETLWAEAIE